MDSLGERLCEGCKRGYILRFDGNSNLSQGSTCGSPGNPEGAESSGGGSESGTLRGNWQAGGDESSDGRSGRGGDAASAAARFIGEVLPSRMLRHVSADIAAAAAPGGTELDPEKMMRRLQIEFHRVKPSGA
jgi:hypothetical protein